MVMRKGRGREVPGWMGGGEGGAGAFAAAVHRSVRCSGPMDARGMKPGPGNRPKVNVAERAARVGIDVKSIPPPKRNGPRWTDSTMAWSGGRTPTRDDRAASITGGSPIRMSVACTRRTILRRTAGRRDAADSFPHGLRTGQVSLSSEHRIRRRPCSRPRNPRTSEHVRHLVRGQTVKNGISGR